MQTWYRRHSYLAVSIVLAAFAAYTHEVYGAGSPYILWVALTVCLINTIAGCFNPGWMMRTMQSSADFVSIAEARNFVQDDYEVIVIEKDGVARAHTDYELWRPHVVGTEDGLNGENVVMTYCAMTNLPVAVKPEVAGKPVDLRVMTQLENNLVLWDRNSGEPIQQIWGTKECDGPSGPSLPEYPCFKMPFGMFAKAYPAGQVFHRRRVKIAHNPLLALYDKFWETQFYNAIHRQKQEAQPIFPTLRHHDDRLPTKLPVWGLNIGDESVCYSIPFVREHGGLLNATVAGRKIVVHWDDEYQSLGIWYNETESDITGLDFFGNSDVGKLNRVENVKCGCFYGMWVNFFPNTNINRFHESAVSNAA